jgi:hypothetical protein
MTGIHAQFRQAWDNGIPFALDRTAERLASEGSSQTDLLDALERLLLEVRDAGANDEEEDKITGVMDRLTGWSHQSSRILTRTESEVNVFTNPAALPASPKSTPPAVRTV